MIGYFRRLRRARQNARISAMLDAEVLKLFADIPPPSLPTPGEVLANTYAAMDAYESLPRPAWDVTEKGPIKITAWQLLALTSASPSPKPGYGGQASNLNSTPIVVVDTVEESTPYTEGWIKP